MHTQLLAQAMRVQGEYSAALTQQASGQKTDTLAGLKGAAGTAVSLESDLKASDRLITQAGSAQSLVETAYGALSSILDIVEAAKVDITATISGTVTDTAELKTAADGWLDEVVSLLNTDIGGLYVFGGNGATTAPIDTSTATLPYQGNETDGVLMVDGDAGITYGVRADEPGVTDMLSALKTLTSMSADSKDLAALQSAYDLLDSAVGDLGGLMETLSSQDDTLTTLVDSQTEFQLYAESALDSITSVDVAAAAATVAQHEAVLQASFSALSSLSSLSLTDYVR